MNLYVENKSFSFVKKCYNDIIKNTQKTVYKTFIINYKGGFSKSLYKFFKKNGIYDIEYILYGVKGLKKAIKCLNLNKNPITLAILITKPLTNKQKNLLLNAKRTIKIIDNSNCLENIEFYKSFNKILYKTEYEDQILDADIMHLYKFYEPIFQCKFSSCLGKNIYVDKEEKVHYCPQHLNESILGNIGDTEKYFNNYNFNQIVKSAIEKRNSCKSNCKHFDYCAGACPLEDGCCNFIELFEKNSTYIDNIIGNNKNLSSEKYFVAKLVIKDVAYEE